MATTGFWPVKGSLKDVIEYARNPDKTTAKKFLDDDLFKALRYVENDDKTDKQMFVSGINCNTKQAYERMMATKSGMATEELMLHIMVFNLLEKEKLLRQRHMLSAWKQQEKCGAMSMK